MPLGTQMVKVLVCYFPKKYDFQKDDYYPTIVIVFIL